MNADLTAVIMTGTGKEYAFYDRSAILRQKFPLSAAMMVVSCAMWVLIFAGISRSRKRPTLWNPVKSLLVPCRARTPRRWRITPGGVALPYIVRIASEKGHTDEVPNDSNIPTIITAVSSAQFYQVQGLIKHLKAIEGYYPDLNLVIYDVGLYKREFELLEKYCNCVVRRFITSAYPNHVADYSNNAWKPIILQTTLDEFGSIMYMEPTARFKGPDSLKVIRNRGWRDFMVWDLQIHVDVVAYTDPEMFRYLGEDRCAFKETGMIDTDIMVLFRSKRTWELMMKPWLKCAFSADCIAPSGSRHDVCFHIRKPKTTGCHRYEQSALSIVLNRALQVSIKRDRYIPPRMTYHTEEEVVVFPEQPWTNTQLYILFGIPVGLLICFKCLCFGGKFKFR
ncbi:uncharacterized protein LOC124285707 [Haliotis rubra]|uniref:uncharacterized protein LOC124285707 n=1 Tax=Haliotis rubra TaxID=36100 RepID=UPI001EE5464E|nr:uncharacterized protein LOC124285707 [Haliotis rubra]